MSRSDTPDNADRRTAAAAGLADRIAWAMKDHYTHELLTGVLASLGLDASASGSKRERVASALAGLGPETVARVAVEAGQGMGDLALADSGECFLEEGRPPLSEITRRDVARCFGHDLAGSRDLVEMLRPLFVLEDPATMFIAGSLADDLRRFASGAEPAWDAERVLTEIGALTCSRARFGELLAAAAHPLARRETAQAELVTRINAVLARDGYALLQEGEESGYPIYRLADLRRGVAGSPKNLIFASIGPKPRIAFADAINNDIVILEHAESCLIYDRPMVPAGLRFHKVLLQQVRVSAMVAIHTDSYSSREWCRREVIEAKRWNVPLVVANSISDLDERGFPYMGNVPVVRLEPHGADRIDFVIGRLLDEVLKDFLWRCRVEIARPVVDPAVVFVPRPPELISLATLPPIAEVPEPVIVYPDPPLSAEEERLFADIAPRVQLRSLTEWLAGAVR